MIAADDQYVAALTPASLATDAPDDRPALDFAVPYPTIAPGMPASAGRDLAITTDPHRVPVVDDVGHLHGVLALTTDLEYFACRPAPAPGLPARAAQRRDSHDATSEDLHTIRCARYTRSMRSRVTVTVDESAVRAAEAAVAAGRAPSVSAWVARAMSDRAQRDRLTDVLAEIRAELGPATDEESAWARSVLGL